MRDWGRRDGAAERRCGTEAAAKGRGAGPETAGRGVRFSRTVDVLAVGAGRSVRLKLAGRRVGGFLCCEGQARSTPEAKEAAGAETGGSAGIPGGRRGRRGAYGVRGCGMGDGGGANRRGGACQRRSEGSGLIPFFGEMREKGGRGKRCVCGTEAAGEGTGRGRERRAGRKARERRGGACAPEQEITPGRGVSPRANRISGSRNLYPQRCCAGCRGQDLRNMGECRRGMPRESFEFRRRQGLL